MPHAEKRLVDEPLWFLIEIGSVLDDSKIVRKLKMSGTFETTTACAVNGRERGFIGEEVTFDKLESLMF